MPFIKVKNIYHDKKSRKTSYPYEEKPKNKLAGYCIQDELAVYLFFVLGSSNSAFIKKFTVEFNSTDHITDRHARFSTHYMRSEEGYCDVTRFELMTHAEAVAKKTNPDNGFVKVGRLADDKWEEIKAIISSERFRKDSKGGSDPRTLEDLIKGVNSKKIAKQLLTQLKL